MKARFTSGSNKNHGGNNLQQLAEQAKAVQNRMQAELEKLESKLYESSSGGGNIKVTITGAMQLSAININPGVLDDIEMLQDLIISAINSALKQAINEKEEVSQSISGNILPKGLF